MTRVRVRGRGWRCVVSRRGRAVAVAAGLARRAQSAFRIEQEHAGGDDLLALLQTRPDLDAIGQLHAERDWPRLEPVAGRDEDVLLLSGVDDGVTRDGEHVLPRVREIGRAVEPRLERPAR